MWGRGLEMWRRLWVSSQHMYSIFPYFLIHTYWQTLALYTHLHFIYIVIVSVLYEDCILCGSVGRRALLLFAVLFYTLNISPYNQGPHFEYMCYIWGRMALGLAVPTSRPDLCVVWSVLPCFDLLLLVT